MNEEKQITDALEQYGRRLVFKERLARAQASIDMDSMRQRAQMLATDAEPPVKRIGRVRELWQTYRSTFAVAAAVAIVTTFSTLFLVRYYRNTTQQQEQYSMLRRDVQAIKQSQNRILDGLSVRRKSLITVNPGQIAGTSFLLNSDGYLVTNNHIVQGADSVYVQSQSGDVYKARVVYADKGYDLAILSVRDDSTFRPGQVVPYGFDPRPSDLGERVFTLGFPRDEIVYGEGYVSSGTGYRNDSSAYQVAISVNPGNSGGPLLDGSGNVIGIISGKQVSSEGASFAIKTDFLYRAISAIPNDSLKGQPLKLSRRSALSRLPRTQQIKRVQQNVYMVKVFKHKE
ncbi:trypsin-like serine protease [Rudanella paleaurantiibacter]|uniref:Trypsin-like serine protease n=1 Tax=Rudanella paleaurantiibacter TaxID=2614655 RepID=A0A7J5U2N6_9BACT|nr:serine protease [Rudanella paleaurantiibacter]KAB7732063.1 trypsin-like serine protease [Rudanella paleaurantiibacter]